jgi:acetyl-CoA C-acetyltransferase
VEGAFRALHAHDIASPIVQALLQRAGVPASAVDALVMGNALGVGGNPARMAALASGLPDHCPAYTIDTQCCSGLDAVGTAANMIASGQAHVVIAGGAEAWSRAPIRQHKPLHANEPAIAYERPPFAPDPTRDPDLLQAAALYANTAARNKTPTHNKAMHAHFSTKPHCSRLLFRSSASHTTFTRETLQITNCIVCPWLQAFKTITQTLTVVSANWRYLSKPMVLLLCC